MFNMNNIIIMVFVLVVVLFLIYMFSKEAGSSCSSETIIEDTGDSKTLQEMQNEIEELKKAITERNSHV